MKNKIIILILLLGLLALVYGLYPSVFNQDVKLTNKSQNNQVAKEIYPACFAGICPTYRPISAIPSDARGQTAIIIPLAMTQGAGKLVIVNEDGEKMFESGGEANIGFKKVDDGNGFILTYSSLYDENFNREDYEVRYVWENDKFVEKK